jgi:DNA primase
MNNIADDIESRIDIVELVREYVPLKKSGANWK